jgi:hypothetical protein
VVGGFVLSLIVVLTCKALLGARPGRPGAGACRSSSAWLAGDFLWMRLKLSESPVFQAMKAQNELAGNPLENASARRATARACWSRCSAWPPGSP